MICRFRRICAAIPDIAVIQQKTAIPIERAGGSLCLTQ
jgi:hypothetical protein